MATALLIIDVQKAILEGACPEARRTAVEGHLGAVVDRLVKLRDNARSSGTPVVLVQHDGPPGDPLQAGTPGWELVEPLKPAKGDLLVHKASCDSFFETSLLDVLTERGITHLAVGGCQTEFCVDTSVRRAVTLGFDVTLIADGHTTGDGGALLQEDIVAHHNWTLDGFRAGSAKVTVVPADKIQF